MDLTFTPEEGAFRAEVRAWLSAHVPPSLPSAGSPEGWDAHRAWERALHVAGYGGLRWPPKYGGRGLGVVHQAIFEEEHLRAGGPERVTVIGQNLMGPTLMVHGTPEQKARWLPGILSADEIWSQGFSEPEAGSDLAGLRTRAERDGEDWIVNGQKIWTSYGTFADWVFALVRTDPEAPRHRGITFLAIDMRSDGVEARPIVQLDGHAGFAEVFFTDVRVPASNIIGDVNEGWAVAMTTLGFERDAPAASPALFFRELSDVVSAAAARGVASDAVVRDRVTALWVRAQSYRHHAARTLSRLAAGESLGAEASITKLMWSEMGHDLVECGLDVQGPYAEVLSEGPMPRIERWHSIYWFSRAATIYAGTSQIQRNIIAERVLGLPKG